MRYALVTGGSRGIGRAIALQLAKQGLAVLVNYVNNQAAAQETIRLIEEQGGKAEALRFDIGNEQEATETLQSWISNHADDYIDEMQRRKLLMIVVLVLSLLIQNDLEYQLSLAEIYSFYRVLLSIYGYCVRPLVLLLFLMLVSDKGKIVTWSFVLILCNAILQMTALFSPVVFYIDPSNHFQRGPLGYTAHIVSLILLFELLIISIRKCYEVRRALMILPIFNALAVIVSVFLDLLSKDNLVSFLSGAMVLCSIFYYIFLHLDYVRKHEEDILKGQKTNQNFCSDICISRPGRHFGF